MTTPDIIIIISHDCLFLVSLISIGRQKKEEMHEVTEFFSSLSCLRQLIYGHHGIFIRSPIFPIFPMENSVFYELSIPQQPTSVYILTSHSVLVIYFHICDDAC